MNTFVPDRALYKAGAVIIIGRMKILILKVADHEFRGPHYEYMRLNGKSKGLVYTCQSEAIDMHGGMCGEMDPKVAKLLYGAKHNESKDD